MALTPLVRQIGGKQRLAAEIVSRMLAVRPGPWPVFVEPFAGAASVACHAVSIGVIPEGATVVLNDPDTVGILGPLAKHGAKLVDLVCRHLSTYNLAVLAQEAMYYQWRNDWNAARSEGSLESGALFFCLRATSFNGLFRKNGSGELNAAWGKRRVIDVDRHRHNLEEWILEVQQKRSLVVSGVDFAQCLADLSLPAAPVLYVDPPYLGTFTGYTAEGFEPEDQLRLLQWLGAMPWPFALSNSIAFQAAAKAYFPTAVHHVLSTVYPVNSDGDGRVPEEEILVCRP